MRTTGDLRMPFGRHRGEYIKDLPSRYLKYLAENCDDNDEVRQAAEDEFDWRTDHMAHDGSLV